MAKIKQLVDVISWNSPIPMREKILTRMIDQNEREIEAEAHMNSFEVDEDAVIQI